MFHTSAYRHEQYISRSKSKRSNKSASSLSTTSTSSSVKRDSIESDISRTDSGYASCTSKQQQQHLTGSNDSLFTSTITESESRRTSEDESVILNALKRQQQQTKKQQKTKKENKFPRQPDFVYSCPRPLAFPFHNDDQFLPIAEADPRDVLRVSPSQRSHSLSRSSSSSNSVKQKISSFDRYGTWKTSTSQPFSYNSNSGSSNSNGGTVRSLRSIFQIPESTTLSNSNNNNSKKIHPEPIYQIEDEPLHPLKKLEIKKGTVQSIKEMFSKLSSEDDGKPSAPSLVTSKGVPRRQSSRVGATIRHYDSKVTKNDSDNQKKDAINPSSTYTHLKEKAFTKRAFEFASHIWKSNTQKVTTSELPKTSSTTNSITTEIKNFSARMLALPSTWLHNNSKEDKKEEKEEEKEKDEKDESIVKSTSTTVGKLWKSFKSFVTGTKVPSIGVL